MSLLKRTISVTFVAFILSQMSFGAALEDLRSAVSHFDWGEAKSIGEILSAEAPDNAEAHYLLGKALMGLGEHEGAAQSFKIANELDPDNAAYRADYGYALVMWGQEMNMFQAGPTYMRAMDQYKTAVKLDPDNLSAHIGLSRYYMNAPAIGGGSMKLAKEHAEEVARLNPYLGHIEAALIASKEKRTEDAMGEYAAAIALKDDEAWLYLELGKLQQELGEPAQAKRSFEKALELDPDNEVATAALASL